MRLMPPTCVHIAHHHSNTHSRARQHISCSGWNPCPEEDTCPDKQLCCKPYGGLVPLPAACSAVDCSVTAVDCLPPCFVLPPNLPPCCVLPLTFIEATASSKAGMTCCSPSLKRRKSLSSPVKLPPLACWCRIKQTAAAAAEAAGRVLAAHLVGRTCRGAHGLCPDPHALCAWLVRCVR